MVLKRLTLALLAVIFTICMFRALFIFKAPISPETCGKDSSHEKLVLDQGSIQRFKKALSFATISHKAHTYEPTYLLKLIERIRTSYPTIHNSNFVRREIVANYTLLYTIEGSNKKLRPYLLTSHLDVVPAVREKWSSDPFEPILREDKHIYARGTIDAKHLLVAMLESLETMLKSGFKPKRSFYLAFGHDEEVGGVEGAQAISKLLPSRLKSNGWDRIEYILDEGNIISRTPVPGIKAPIALVGVAEKGYVTVKFSTIGAVGHGSMPPTQTAISKLSKAIGKFHSHLFPSLFCKSVEREMIETFAYHSSWPYKFAYANFWLFSPIFDYIFSQDPGTNSLIRTSTAVTMISGGTKENVLPDSATALVNHRVHQLQTINDVIEFDRQIVNDPSIDVRVQGHYTEATKTSPYDENSLGFQWIKKSVSEIYPGSVVVPSVFLAASDSKWYVNLTDSIYRFSAIAVPLEEMNRFHGHDERISLENFENLINFFHHLMMNSDKERLDQESSGREEL